MLVIEGFAGKSLVVQEYLETLDCEKVLTCDREIMNLNHLNFAKVKPDVFVIRVTDGEVDEFIEGFRETIKLEGNQGFNDVVFYMNTTRDNIDKFKALEDEFGFNAVLTVQTPDRENPREVIKYNV
jgi:hypothetical protein